MKLSELYNARRHKFKLKYPSGSNCFSKGALLKIVLTQNEKEFFVSTFGIDQKEKTSNTDSVLCKADYDTSTYILQLLDYERSSLRRCIFVVDEIYDSFIEVQTYSFESIIEYKTPIFIQVSEKLVEEKKTPEYFYKDYVWDQLGIPAVFCCNYKNRKKQNADIRFLSGKKYLLANNTPQGIIAKSEYYFKDRDFDLPIDMYLAPEIKFVNISENAQGKDPLSIDLDKVSNSQTYLARWDAYNELSKLQIEQESAEFGELQYTSCKMTADLSSYTFEFKLKEGIDSSFIGKEVGVCRFSSDNSLDSKKAPDQINVGKIVKVFNNTVVTCLETMDGIVAIPETGSLSLFTQGDKFILIRRDRAKKRMIKHESPIKSLVALIETGTSEYMLSDWGTHKAVTEELKRNFKKATTLNDQQLQALDIAINTPDIAIIQGPPGTGKTTVIKAICERFREIFEAEERQKQKLDPDHPLHSPRILISSFQNEAVDNAISAPLAGDIPAFRKTAKRAKKSTTEQYQKSLDSWYKGVQDAIEPLISNKDISQFVENQQRLQDEYRSYKNSGESLEKAERLINHYLSFTGIDYPEDLVNAAKKIIRNHSLDSIDDEDPIVVKLNSQCLSFPDFSKEEKVKAKRLVSYIQINDDLDIDDSVLDALIAVCGDTKPDEEAFTKFVSAVKQLKKKYSHSNDTLDDEERVIINECLLALSNCFKTQYVSTLTDIDSKKSLILSEFLARLEQEYESIVRKYSKTTAATCQTSLELGNPDKTYDLVVIDEAARANPLDLFIPMSMGKKIVLVGDHKQLPHMLEPNVLKMIMKDPKFKDLPELEKSLFERLFGMFSTGQKPKAVLLTNQFRMHPDICKFVSEEFYEGQLKTAESVSITSKASHPSINNGKALTFVNIPASAGCETKGVSKSRNVEVKAVTAEAKKILDCEKNEDIKIGIITFYSAQAELLEREMKSMLNDEQMNRITIGTVDAFQGKEFDYVILSCVRSNIPKSNEDLPEVGFLKMPNRLCVAFSRAIRQLIVFGDKDTLMQIPCFSRLYTICKKEGGGCYREY